MPNPHKERIKAGMVVKFRGGIFDVIKYDGEVFKSFKGKLKLMEQKSMFEGGRDFFLHTLSETECNRIKIL